MCKWVSQLFIIFAYLLQTIRVRVILLLLSKGGPLVINNKVDREKGTFEPNIDVKGGIDWREFKGVYDSVVKVDV